MANTTNCAACGKYLNLDHVYTYETCTECNKEVHIQCCTKGVCDKCVADDDD